MTSGIGEAFSNGLHREQALFPQREQWTQADWWDRKLFLDQALQQAQEGEADDLWCAELEGRLMAVCVEGMRRFER